MNRNRTVIDGFIKSGFEPVHRAFEENFTKRKELGAACCVYCHGEKVVDLWGGVRNKATGERWQQETMNIVFSTTKGLSAMAIAVAHSHALLNYDDLVATHWPEFAQHGKEQITIRQLLAHQAALFAFKEQGDRTIVGAPDRLACALARQKPAWRAGLRQAYHAIALGYYEGELLRRVDPSHRTLGRFFQDEIATPLGLDVYIRLPEKIANSQLATLQIFNPALAVFTLPTCLYFSFLNPHSIARKALKGSLLSLDRKHVYARNFEVPAAGGVGTARAIAKAYGVFATGGKQLRLSNQTLLQLTAPPLAPERGFLDAALKVPIRFSLGFMRPDPQNPFGAPSAFGHAGAGGSFAFADPENEIGYAYVPNRMGSYLIDPRDHSLRKAMYTAIGISNPYLETLRKQN